MFLTESRSEALASNMSSQKFYPDKLTKIEDQLLLTESIDFNSSIKKPLFEK